MKVSGEATLHAPISEVWAALTDPTVLERAIPGCERLEADGTDRYSMTLTAGVASVKGTYLGEVILTDQRCPDSFVLRASGSGGPGTVEADVDVRLKAIDDDSTHLSYVADAMVGGVVAGVGQRMLAGVAKKMADQFFRSVDDVLIGTAELPLGGGTAAPVSIPFADAAATDQRAIVPPVGAATAASGGAPGGASFRQGVVVGAVIGLAGVLVGAFAGRLSRR